VLFGGAVRVSINPRLLPLGKLRRAGFVEIRLSGPASALPRFEAELRAVLRRNRLSVNAWARAEAKGGVVRAKIIIWPPGTRPPGR
jgi:hypothetical protein